MHEASRATEGIMSSTSRREDQEYYPCVIFDNEIPESRSFDLGPVLYLFKGCAPIKVT